MEGLREAGDARDLIERRHLEIHTRQIGVRASAKSRVRIRLEAASFPNLHWASKPFRNQQFRPRSCRQIQKSELLNH